MRRKAAANRWRRILSEDAPPAALESAGPSEDSLERIARAKEAMIRLIKDRFGGDSALLKAVDQLAITGEEAVAILSDPSLEPHDDHLGALEAIVLFDGTRPSFLVKDGGIDFTSSFNTGTWADDLRPALDSLAHTISCVGRVELGETHIGTAFLVTPTLAITNRHVAQSIATIGNAKMTIKSNVFVDFGREQANGKKSFDRRKVEALLFTGKDPIINPINHGKLDLAIIRVAPSTLAGDEGQRHLTLTKMDHATFDDSTIVTAMGYPGAPGMVVPDKIQSQFEPLITRMLEGDGGAKRFAPGKPMIGEAAGLAPWTIRHDASTVGGNSGSPVGVVRPDGGAQVAQTIGLHYGGDWGGERTNWAHLLSMAGASVGYGGTKTLAEFFAAEGIVL
jgi:V8-like Glu-specific endopeptidase